MRALSHRKPINVDSILEKELRRVATALKKKIAEGGPSRRTLQMPANTRWFQHQCEAIGMSQRKLAETLKLDPSAITLIFHGKRRLRLDEATALARLWGVPLEEVLANAGVELPRDRVESRETVKIQGWVDGALVVHMEPPKGPKTAPQPIFGGKNIAVVRYQTAGTPFDGMDGALVYYQPRDTVDAEAVGRLCVVQLAEGEWRIGVVKRGYQAGRFNLTTMGGQLVEEGVQLLSASPVVWMKL